MRIAIIHPWLPQYRLDFFEQLVRKGAEVSIDIVVFHGDPPPEWRARQDSGQSSSFHHLPTRFFEFRGRSLNYKSLTTYKSADAFDLVIVEQAVRNLETYLLRLAGTPLAYWGHGKTYTKKIGRAQERLKQRLTQGGHWFFSYTGGGVEAVVAAGYPRNRTTVVQNSINTSHLQLLISNVTLDALDQFNDEHDLQGRTAIFIGGLDSSKRIPFLLDAAAAAHKLDSRFRLLVVGAGIDSATAGNKAESVPWLSYLGPLFGQNKALALRASQVMAMPGRVGLVAVDSFASGLPIITTDWAWHAPEFEYLQSGVNAVVTRDNTSDYARALVDVTQNEMMLADLTAACVAASETYTVEAMVENFLSGISAALKTLAK